MALADSTPVASKALQHLHATKSAKHVLFPVMYFVSKFKKKKKNLLNYWLPLKRVLCACSFPGEKSFSFVLTPVCCSSAKVFTLLGGAQQDVHPRSHGDGVM